MTNESTNLKASGNIEMNEIRALSAVELDAVSGGAVTKAFDFTVAGMHVVGAYDTSAGDYFVMVVSGGRAIKQYGKV